MVRRGPTTGTFPMAAAHPTPMRDHGRWMAERPYDSYATGGRPLPDDGGPTLRSVVKVVGARARVVADDVANDLCHSSRALTIEGLPDRETTTILRIWFVVAAAVVGFLLATTLASAAGRVGTLASSDVARAPRAARFAAAAGPRALIVTPVRSAPNRAAVAAEEPPAAPVPLAAIPAPPPKVVPRAVPVVAKAAPPPAPAPPPAAKNMLADALK